MRFDKRLEWLEKKVLPKDLGPKFLLTFSDQDQIEKIAKHEAENPGMPYAIIRVNLIAPSGRKNDGDGQHKSIYANRPRIDTESAVFVQTG